MPVCIFRLTNKGHEKVLANDVKIKASTQECAMFEVQKLYPGYSVYVLIDIKWDR